jgi:hypothetical protein
MFMEFYENNYVFMTITSRIPAVLLRGNSTNAYMLKNA